MTTQKQILNSHSPSVGRDRGPYSAHYAVNDGYRGWILLLIILVALGGAALVFAQNATAQTQAKAKPKTQYHVSTLASLGGTSSGGNSINDQSWVAGYSRLPDRNRHATLWRNGALTRPLHPRRTKQQCNVEREKYRGNHRGYFPNSHAGAARRELE